jgi:hypothetical protein
MEDKQVPITDVFAVETHADLRNAEHTKQSIELGEH